MYHLICRQADGGATLRGIVSNVCLEHAIHDCYADEFYEVLALLHAGSEARNPDMIGYMLRCCFETIRRHLEWEDLTLMPLAKQVLTVADLTSLSETLAENRGEVGLRTV